MAAYLGGACSNEYSISMTLNVFSCEKIGPDGLTTNFFFFFSQTIIINTQVNNNKQIIENILVILVITC